MKILQNQADTVFLPRAKNAEDLGLSSTVIRDILQELTEKGSNWHTCMVMKDGVVAAEVCRFPFTATQPHCMYSISKNITGIALGFAVAEGKLSLDARIIDLFPEYDFGEDLENIKKLTVRHLITMTSGKRPNYLLSKTDADWLPHLFDAKWISEPGEKFEYVNENSYCVCAILHRVLGQSVVDYLDDRLWKPLGIVKPYWETDHKGIESGGWGINLSPESMAKIFVCVQNKGVFNGRQVIPAAWLEQATVSQLRENIERGDILENGYGFSFWMRDKNIFCGEGMYGQIAAMHRNNGMVVCFTGGQAENGDMWNAIMQIMARAPFETAPSEKADLKAFAEQIPADVLTPSVLRSPMEKVLHGKTIRFAPHKLIDKIGFPFSVIPTPAVYMTKDRGGNIDDVQFEFRSDSCLLTWREGDEINTVECGMDGYYRYTQGLLCSRPYLFAGAAVWEDAFTLRVTLRPMECLASRTLLFRFENGTAEMTPAMSPPISMMVDNIAGFVRGMAKSKPMQNLADKALKKLETVIEPVHCGTYKQ